MTEQQTYTQAVEEAAACLADGEAADWRLAQLTYENTRRGAGRPSAAPPPATMAQWCADVQARSSVRARFGVATGSRYARVWAKYGLGNSTPATNFTFKDAYAEQDGTPDRERMMEYEGTRLLERGTPTQKVEQAAALLKDPDVREQAADVGTPLGATVLGVNIEQRERTRRAGEAAERAARERTQREPGLKTLDEGQALLDIERACDAFARAVAEALPRVGRIDPAAEAGINLILRLSYARARGAVDQVGDLLETGRVGGRMDEWVRSILEEGGKQG